jgi:hypothetical protein
MIMNKVLFIALLLIILVFSSCSNKAGKQTTTDLESPTPASEDESEVRDAEEEIYCFDAAKDWDVEEYRDKHGQELSYFSAPIQTPNKYTYQCSNDTGISEIALELGNIMMNDFMRDYEGKTFTVTEFHNLTAHILDTAEFNEWEENYSKLGKHVELKDNQWLCSYTCEYKYTGVYSGIGEMPADTEWMNTLYMDGSGENYIFIIQKENDSEYILRALPKTVIERKED